MASGIKITDEVKTMWNRVHQNTKKQEKFKFAVFRFSDDLTKIIVETQGKSGDENWEYDNLISNLPSADVRYIAYDFDYQKTDGTNTSKVVLVSWCPESSPVKKKMVGASTFNALKAALGNPEKCFEGDCVSDVNSTAVLDKLGAKACLNK